MNISNVVAIGCILLCACAKGNDANAKRVSFFCHDFTHDVAEVATAYQSRLALETSALSEPQKAAADLKYRIVGREARGERGLAMVKDFLFCSGVRNDSSKTDPLSETFGIANQSYREAPDLATATKAASDMATSANELDKLEIRP
jgi:hypothetical protein